MWDKKSHADGMKDPNAWRLTIIIKYYLLSLNL